MKRVTILLYTDNPSYSSVEADRIEEDENFIRTYTNEKELTAIFDKNAVKGAYITEQKK